MCKGCTSRAGQAKISAPGNSQHTEIRVANNFALEPVHIGRKSLYRLAGISRAGVGLTENRKGNIPVKALQFARTGNLKFKYRIKAMPIAAQRAAITFALTWWKGHTAHLAYVRTTNEICKWPIKFHSRARGQAINNHKHLNGAFVIAPNGR